MTQDSVRMTQDSVLKIIECPRDAMQGIHRFIPTERKVSYINSLLKVGFDTIDFGSFVSPKAIPQMRDTPEVLDQLELENGHSDLLAIVANLRGTQQASAYKQIKFLGFPLSLSETFQQRNTNKSIAQAFQLIDQIQELCGKSGQSLVVYLSMGFGNPYGDPYDVGIVEQFAEKLQQKGIKIVSLADTIASATPETIRSLFGQLSTKFKDLALGLHLHTQRDEAYMKIQAAYEAGCRRVDGALLGLGGCPMAKDELVGNLPTEEIVRYLDDHQLNTKIDKAAFQHCLRQASALF